MPKKQIVVVGVGAVGTFLAAFLAKDPENEIILCDVPEREKVIREQGVIASYTEIDNGAVQELKYPANRFKIGYQHTNNPDLVILGTKSFDISKKLIANINSISGDKARILFTQLGLPDFIYKQFKAPAIGMSVNMGVNMYGATSKLAQSLKQLEHNILPIGVVYPHNKKIDISDIETLFTASGLKAFKDVGSEISKEMYKKIIVRLSYGLLTVPDSYLQQKALSIGNLDGTKIQPLVSKLSEEVNTVAKALGYGVLYTPEGLKERVKGLDTHFSSTALDAANHEKIEASTLIKVIADAKKFGVKVPHVEKLNEVFDLINQKKTYQLQIEWKGLLEPTKELSRLIPMSKM